MGGIQNNQIVNAGSVVPISWTASDDKGVNSVMLQYSIDGGTTFSTIATNLAASGTYQWTVPNISTTSAQIVAYAFDAGGNQGISQSPIFAINYAPTYSLSVTLAGTGGGSVHSSPLTDISCIKGSSSGCSASFDADTVVSLTATPDSITSTFDGWSGACSAAPCNITMNADKNVTATFTLAPLTKNKTTNTAYATLAQALATAASGAELLVLGTQHDGAVSLNTSIILNGGWSPAYLAKSGLPSTLNGNLSILGGNSSAEDLMVKGQLVIQGGSLRVNEVTVRP